MTSLWELTKSQSKNLGPILTILYSDGPDSPVNLTVRELFSTIIESAVCGQTLQGQLPTLAGGLDPDNLNHHPYINRFVTELRNALDYRVANNAPSGLPRDTFVITHQIRHANEKIDRLGPIVFFRKLRDCIKIELDALAAAVNLHPVLTNEMNQIESQIQKIENAFKHWKFHNSRWPLFGMPYTNHQINLNTIKSEANALLDHLANRLKAINHQSTFGEPSEKESLQKSISRLIRATFIFCDEPQLVVMEKAQPQLSATFQLGSQLQIKNPLDSKSTVGNLYILNEAHAKILQENGTITSIAYKDKETGELLKIFKKGTNVAHLESSNFPGEYIVTFKKPHIKNNIRSVNMEENEESTTSKALVMFQKLCFAVQIPLQVHLFDKPLELWTTSVPWTFASHESQSPSGIGATVWDYCTAQVNRLSFTVADEISWDIFIENLSEMFKHYLGEGLNDVQKECLYQKAFHSYTESKTTLSWSEFVNPKFVPSFGADAKPAEKKWFSFSEWLFSAFLLLKFNTHNNQLPEFWRKGFIVGFIDKIDAERKLAGKAVGTFLLRFSDSKRGAISIVCVLATDDPLKSQVLHLKPFTKDELTKPKSASLADKIKSITPKLRFLYGFDKPVDTLFEPFYTSENKTGGVVGYTDVKNLPHVNLPSTNSSTVTSPSSPASTTFPGTPSTIYNGIESVTSFDDEASLLDAIDIIGEDVPMENYENLQASQHTNFESCFPQGISNHHSQLLTNAFGYLQSEQSTINYDELLNSGLGFSSFDGTYANNDLENLLAKSTLQ